MAVNRLKPASLGDRGRMLCGAPAEIHVAKFAVEANEQNLDRLAA